MTRSVAVFGASGFVGRHVVERLREDGCDVRPIGRRELDMTRATVEQVADAIRGCEAVVNLVGIKREQGRQTFEAVHVRLVETIIDAMRGAGVACLVHISVVVSRPDPASGYHDTKWRAEEIVARSGLQHTILKPGVIYGVGDDMLSHLRRMIRTTPVFPVVGDGSSLLQPVHVEDVARAVSRALASTQAAGKTYDVVGPYPLPLGQIVRIVAEAMGRSVWIVPAPVWLMRPAVVAMDGIMSRPLSTPAQLQMLIDGMTGDPAPLERDLGVRPRPFTVDAVRDVFNRTPQRAPRRWKAPLLAMLAFVVATAGFRLGVLDVWWRLIIAMSAIGAIGLIAMGRERRDVARARAWDVPLGLLGAAVLYGGAWAVTRVGPVAAWVHDLYAWRSGHAPWLLAVTLVAAVAGEEIFWRGVITRWLLDRGSPLVAVVLAALINGLAHAGSGSWLLPAAAVGTSLVWGALFALTGRLAAPFLSHLLFDLLVLLVVPIV